MSKGFACLDDQQEAVYREKVECLGLDPDFETSGDAIVVPVRGLPALRMLFGGDDIDPATVEMSPLTVEKVPELTDMMCRQAIVNYAFGIKNLANEMIIEELENRFPVVPVLAYVAPDITVTAANPLIINNNSAVTVFGKVTIKDGGYIVISVDTNFYCEHMEKVAGGNSPATHDITIQGNDGLRGPDGRDGQPGRHGDNGSNAACDCCGGLVSHNGSDGGEGGNGTNGANGINGEEGARGPTVYVSIGSLTGNVTLLNRGGYGGDGGNGGYGGRGGDGGRGGNGVQCGVHFRSGKTGGRGGDGGNGGASAHGGNAGNGGTVVVTYSSANEGSLLIGSNEAAHGGRKGNSGAPGAGGAGGPGGNRGGRQGANGGPGTPGSDNGRDGSRGNTGTLTINGQPV